MRVDVRREAGVVVLEPVGDIDAKTAPDFTREVLGFVQPQARIILSLKGVAFMSSAGLRAMLLICREAKGKSATVVLAEVAGNVRNSMSATGFLSFFVVADSVDDAMQTAR